MGTPEVHKGDHTMALAKDKAKLAIAAVKSEDMQVKRNQLHITFLMHVLVAV
jgi:hypothetical protein